MKEENRDLYRLDPLKVRQKIFDMYPPNSKERDGMIREEKLKELGHLNEIKQRTFFDPNVFITLLKRDALKSFLKGIASFAALFGLGFLLTYVTTTIELIFVGFGIGFSFVLLLKFLKDAFLSFRIAKTFNKEYEDIDKRISDLKKDIFSDITKENR